MLREQLADLGAAQVVATVVRFRLVVDWTRDGHVVLLSLAAGVALTAAS